MSICLCVCVFSHSAVSDSFVTPWTVACQASQSMKFVRQEYWSGLPIWTPGSSQPRDQTFVSSSPALAGGFFTTEPWGKPHWVSQFSSVTQSCLTLCNPLDCSAPGFPVFHYLPEFAQTHVHWVSDAIQPSHPLSPPSPPALSLSHHQGLFQWVSSSHEVAKVLEFQL